jgi:hypothetical protein
MYRILLINNRKVLQRLSDSASIPSDKANNDYLDYLKWVSEGNVAEEHQPE